MRFRTLALASAAVLALGLSACAPGTTQTPAGQGTTSAPATSAPATTEAATQGGQATPEAAGEGFLHALGAGNAENVCRMMAGNGIALESSPAGIQSCAPVMEQAINATKSFSADLSAATVANATIDGDRATFTNATVEPANAKTFLTSFSAIKVGDKWYIGQ